LQLPKISDEVLREDSGKRASSAITRKLCPFCRTCEHRLE